MQNLYRSATWLLTFTLAVACLSAIAQDELAPSPSGPAPVALQFVPLPPCRVVDTRNPNGTFGGPAIQAGTSRNFPIGQGGCRVPLGATAFSLNVSVVPAGSLGYLTVWPTGQPQPFNSTLNSVDGRIKANAAIVAAGNQGGAISIFASDTTDVVVDIDGYFVAPKPSALAFYPLPPCRVVDTRDPNQPQNLGPPSLVGGAERAFPILQSACGVPTTAQAYSFNVTVVPVQPVQPLGFITVWPTHQPQPYVSTLNNLTGTVVANAAIVAAGTPLGEFSVYATSDTDLVVDINGYFARPGANGLSLYLVPPCRVLDTRQGSGAFDGEIAVDVLGSPCAPSPNAQSYVLNATVVPQGPLGYLSLFANGGSQPVVSTLNAVDGVISSNMAIVPTTNGQIDAYASSLTDLILDISSYFAP